MKKHLPKLVSALAPAFALAMLLATPSVLLAQHGDAAPKEVSTKGLAPLGKEWKEENPYRGDAQAVEIGKDAYNQNCARCHGLEGISGGFAPDLRKLQPGKFGDEVFVLRVRNGATRNGVTLMPKMAEVLSQETLWSIRTWLESVHAK